MEVPLKDGTTCAQRKQWGNCNDDWVVQGNYCRWGRAVDTLRVCTLFVCVRCVRYVRYVRPYGYGRGTKRKEKKRKYSVHDPVCLFPLTVGPQAACVQSPGEPPLEPGPRPAPGPLHIAALRLKNS